MGQFSWLDCQDRRQILDNIKADVYVLIPEEFGGGHIHERCYDGYGHFGGEDIYALVADWNRKYLSEHPERLLEATEKNLLKFSHYETYTNLDLPLEEVKHILGSHYRDIGISIACYDKENESLLYPIKITHDKKALYKECKPSLRDPDQGWKM